MSYEHSVSLAQTTGLVLLAACFLVAVIYALWPGNRDKFNRAARAPLNDEEQDGR